MESESAINQVHPDGEPDDADLFFGGDDDETEVEAPQAEETAEAELSDPDPGTFNPESGKFDDPDPTPAESDGPTDMDPTPGVPDADSPATESIPTTSDAPVSTEESSEETSQSDTTPDSETGTSSASTTTDASSDGSSESGKTSGALEREYRVFHKLQLTEKALKFLLAELDEGRAPEPRVVYLQVHKTMARNVNGAITEAYTKHKKTIGDKTDLAAVSSRAFQERHVEPKQRPETYLSIS